MKKLLLPLILLIMGVGAGVGAGLALTPAEPEVSELGPCGDVDSDHSSQSDGHDEDAKDGDEKTADAYEYAKLGNQFVVPVVKDGQVEALVIVALSIEVTLGAKDVVFLAEPKLRDEFLQAMFDHANIGGFDGNFTSSANMRPLREELTRRGKLILPDVIHDVLIVDIVRQDN